MVFSNAVALVRIQRVVCAGVTRHRFDASRASLREQDMKPKSVSYEILRLTELLKALSETQVSYDAVSPFI